MTGNRSLPGLGFSRLLNAYNVAPPAPCDNCPGRARCRDELLACTYFERYVQQLEENRRAYKDRRRYALTYEADKETYNRIFHPMRAEDL